MRPNFIQTISLMALIAATLFILPGCLVSGSKTESIEGTRVSKNTLAQIEIGETTDAWVRAALGEPTSRQAFTRRDGTESGEVWRYEWNRTVRSSGTVFLLFAGSGRTEEQTVANIEIIDGVVTRYWMESDN